MSTLGEVLHDGDEGEPLRLRGEAWPGMWIGEAPGGWAPVAQWLSGLVGGLVMPGGECVTWVMGRRVERVASRPYCDLVGECRLVCDRLGVEPGSSLGSCARALLSWAVRPQYREKGLYRSCGGVFAGYHDVTPGQWEDGQEWDCQGCYYQLLRRLPSVRVSLTRGGLLWHGMSDLEHERWAAVLEAVSGLKPLRNSLWGVMLGSSEGRLAWHKGERVTVPGKMGPNRPAAIVVGRSAYDLCALASQEVASVLSNTDCVVAVDGCVPTVWESHGLPVRLKASGETHVCNIASFRIGTHVSEFYNRGSRYADFIARTEGGDTWGMLSYLSAS